MTDNNANKKGYKKTKLGWIPEEWEVVTLGKISFEPQYGLSESSVEYNPLLPRYIRITDINEQGNLDENNKVSVKSDNYIQYILNEGDILFARTGATVGKTYFHKSCNTKEKKVVFAGYLIRFIVNEQFALKKYIFQYTQSLNYNYWVKSMFRAGAQPNINSQEYSSLPILLPSKPEQEKIAEILSTWDEGIETLEKLIEQKQLQHKALMKNLLTGEIRIEKKYKWKHSKFNQIFQRIQRKNINLNDNILTISAQQGLISQKEFYNKRIASTDVSKYILLMKNEFAYNKSYSTGYPLGAIKRLEQYNKGIVSSLYICFSLIDTKELSDFWKLYFESGCINKEIKMVAQEGARNHGLLNISAEDFFNMLLYYPESSIEREKIAEVLNESEYELVLLSKKLKKLKGQKKGLMQKLLTGQVRVKV